jgi:hypothetical protein
MFAGLIIMLTESWIKKEKKERRKKKEKNIRMFLVSIDYREYF